MTAPTSPRLAYRILAGMALLLAGVGMVRYAYGPLLPSMFHAKWLDPTSAAYIGSVNFAANVLMAMLCPALTRRFTVGRVMRWTMMIGVLSTAANAFDFGIIWIGACRALAGATAGTAIILTPILCIQGLERSKRSVVVGLAFFGSGVGVVAASLLIPMVTTTSPDGGWLLISGVTLAATIFTWKLMQPVHTTASATKPAPLGPSARRAMLVLLCGYTLFAMCSVPHAIFLSAYLHDRLHVGRDNAAMAYAAFGIGLAIGGPLISSLIARFAGLRTATVVSAALGAMAITMVLAWESVPLVIASGVIMGTAQMGMVPVCSNCCLELAGPTGHTRWWSILSVGFTLGISIGTLGIGAMFHAGWGYRAAFEVAAIASAASITLMITFWFLSQAAKPDDIASAPVTA